MYYEDVSRCNVLDSEIRVEAYHHGVDAGVNLDEHPDRRRHVAHSSPHGQHGAGVVVLLESGATLSLNQNDDGVEDFIELGEVEPPTPERKSLVPHPTNVGAVRHAIGANVDVRVPAAPAVRIRVVGDRVAEASRSLDLAEGVDSTNKGIGLPPVGEGRLQAVEHGEAGKSGVYCEEDIVRNDERLEPAVARDPPRLVAMLAVVPVEVGDGRGVDSGDGQGDLGVERLLKEVLRDLERVRESRFTAVWVRDGRRCSIWGEPQDGPRRDLPGKE